MVVVTTTTTLTTPASATLPVATTATAAPTMERSAWAKLSPVLESVGPTTTPTMPVNATIDALSLEIAVRIMILNVVVLLEALSPTLS